MIDHHGTDLGGGRYQINVTQAALADEANVAASTIQDRLVRLVRDGIVLTTKRPIITHHPHHLTGRVHGGTVLQFPARPDTTPVPGWQRSLLEANRALAEAAAHPDAPTATILATQASLLGVLTNQPGTQNAGPGPAETRGVVVESSEEVVDSSSNSLTDSPPVRTGPRSAAGTRGKVADPDQVSRILGLVAPLVDTASKLGMVGITNRAGLIDALSGYTDDQIRYAVTQTQTKATASARTSNPMTSPIGWLIKVAEANDPDLFPPQPPTPQPEPEREPEPDRGPGLSPEQQRQHLVAVRRSLHPTLP